jgi:hypothetical protein
LLVAFVVEPKLTTTIPSPAWFAIVVRDALTELVGLSNIYDLVTSGSENEVDSGDVVEFAVN